jgi:hypothetical protein
VVGKSVGITILSIVVAVAAFIVSNIWTQGLHEKVDLASRSTDSWTMTYNSVNREELAMSGAAPADLESAEHRLEKTLQLIDELNGAITGLMQTDALNSDEINSATTMTYQYGQFIDRPRSAHSLDDTLLVDKRAAALFGRLRALGVLINSRVLARRDELQERESYVKYIGYTLSLLAIIVAGLAQLGGKG